ncbi:hypothetical protein [Methylobacterium sp. 13MFTsu3.1M2]|uniref:hypothetical protein n=1 Tax=Methylobacterium sp. 13MFTsu3.1M2 TaxID=1502776 RepID=UPI0008E8EC43|nr:hypothetical protein [Methylobacterium sp. 13MFTsu3.1M2]SFE10227.1 hypothetical protein SAMN02799627_02566 [Methylobacterium sp. 13MFTsu3.1M2]
MSEVETIADPGTRTSKGGRPFPVSREFAPIQASPEWVAATIKRMSVVELCEMVHGTIGGPHADDAEVYLDELLTRSEFKGLDRDAARNKAKDSGRMHAASKEATRRSAARIDGDEPTLFPLPLDAPPTVEARSPSAPEIAPEPAPTVPTALNVGDVGDVGSEGDEGEAEDEADEPNEDEDGAEAPFETVLNFVRGYCATNRLHLRLDGTISDIEVPTTLSFEDIEAASGLEDQTRQTLRLDIRVAALRAKLKTGNLNVAVDQWMKEQRQDRRSALFKLTSVPSAQVDPTYGWNVLRKLAEVRFEGDPEYSAAMIEQIIWETKRRAWGEGVENPHFFMFTSATQWNGKSTLARNILSPISEAIRANVELRALLDTRWHDLWKSYALIIDEIPPKGEDADRALAILKGRITTPEHNLRPMATNDVIRSKNRTTLVGTSQYRVIDCFGDASGMRRYVEIKMREGRRYLEWPEARAVTEVIDWPRVWRGVDMLGQEPIYARDQYETLKALQEAMKPPVALDTFDEWVVRLSPTRDKTYLAAIRTSSGHATISDLYRSYRDYVVAHRPRGGLLSEQAFENRMRGVTRNISTKRGRTPDALLSHHTFEKDDGRKTTQYVYIGPNP